MDGLVHVHGQRYFKTKIYWFTLLYIIRIDRVISLRMMCRVSGFYHAEWEGKSSAALSIHFVPKLFLNTLFTYRKRLIPCILVGIACVRMQRKAQVCFFTCTLIAYFGITLSTYIIRVCVCFNEMSKNIWLLFRYWHGCYINTYIVS